MKKALTVALVMVLAVSALAFAGPYFSVENSGITVALTGIGGVDNTWVLQADFPQASSSITADINWTFPANDLEASISAVQGNLGAELKTTLNFRDLPCNATPLLKWDTSLEITGSPFDGITVWGGVSFNYGTGAPTAPPVGWTLVPIVGIEARW